MTDSRFHQLLNRRIDQLLTPEEEREWNQLLVEHPERAADLESWERIQNVLHASRDVPIPEGLSDRIADRVLQGDEPNVAQTQTASFFSRPWARIAAGFMLVALIALGTHIAMDRPAFAGRGQSDRQEAQILEAWKGYRLSDAQQTELLALKKQLDLHLQNKDAATARRLENQHLGAILRLFDEVQRARYAQEHSLTDQEMVELMALPAIR